MWPTEKRSKRERESECFTTMLCLLFSLFRIFHSFISNNGAHSIFSLWEAFTRFTSPRHRVCYNSSFFHHHLLLSFTIHIKEIKNFYLPFIAEKKQIDVFFLTFTNQRILSMVVCSAYVKIFSGILMCN